MRWIRQPLIAVGMGILVVSLLGYGCAARTSTPSRPRGVDLYVAGVSAYQAGDADKARRQLEWATQVNPELRMARSMLGDLYRSDGNYPAARRHYEALAKLDMYSAWNHYRLGITYQFLQMFKEAAASYLRALDLKPNDWQTNMNLGLTYMALDQSDDALKFVTNATRLAPEQAQTWSNLGVVFDARGDYTQAEQAYRKALELDNSHAETMLNLGANLTSQGKSAEALAVLEQVVMREQNPLTHKHYGDALMHNRRFDAAIREYDAALKLNDRYFPALNAKGMALIRVFQERDLELNDASRLAALESWSRSLAIHPHQPRIQALVKRWNDPKLFDE